MIYNFNQYRQLNQSTLDFISGKMDESEFIHYLNSELTTESLLGDFIGNFKQKVIDIFWSFLTKSYEIGFIIFDKINTFVKWLFNKIKSFKEKNPVLYKVIVITSITLIILIVASATAQAGGKPIPKDRIDMAIGLLDGIKSDNTKDTLLVNKAIAHLIDLRDGKVDIQGLGNNAINMAEAALKTIDKIVADSKSETSPTFFKYCMSLIEKGSSYVSAIYSKSHGSETIKLIVK